MKKYALIVILLLAALGSFAAYRVTNNDLFFLIKKNFTLFSEVYNEIAIRYVDEVNPETLMRRGLESMLQALDPYTVLFDESQTQQMNILTTGKYAGVGIEVGTRGGQLVVLVAMEGYSAHKKGVRAGDMILAVNNFDVTELSPEELELQLLGEAGTKLTLKVRRYGIEQDLEFELIRERIELKNLTYSTLLDPQKRIGYVVISRFGQGTAAELRTALETLSKEGPLEGLILDLRSNPGGLLDEAVKTVNKFVDPGIEVVRTKGRTPDTNFGYTTEELPLLPDTPLVILQDGGSASASEIVAGAIQDLDRGVILGERSFGKGLVQIIRPLSYDISMKITVSKYYIPSGRSIQSVLYTHEGSETEMTTQVPDSLRRPFKTKGGRMVYDGAGIEPDIPLKKPMPSMFEIALLQNSKFFLFVSQHPQIKLGSDGTLPESVYAEFVQWLKKDGFSFKTQTEVMIADLETHLSETGLSASSRSEIQALKNLAKAKRDADLTTYKSSILQELHLELAARDGGMTERLKVKLAYDPVVKQAQQLLEDLSRYQQLLKPRP
jgi:carboxyl-terminal processing protease